MSRGGRRKEVPCALCEEPTLDDGGVCDVCRDLAKLGATIIAKQKRDKERVVVEMPRWRLDLSPSDGKPIEGSKSEAEISSADLAAAMGLVDPPEPTKSYKMTNEVVDHGKRIAIGFSQIRQRGSYDSAPRKFLGTKEQAEATAALFVRLQNIVTAAYHDGFDRGRNLLASLSSGEVKLEYFDEQIDSRGKYWGTKK